MALAYVSDDSGESGGIDWPVRKRLCRHLLAWAAAATVRRSSVNPGLTPSSWCQAPLSSRARLPQWARICRDEGVSQIAVGAGRSPGGIRGHGSVATDAGPSSRVPADAQVGGRAFVVVCPASAHAAIPSPMRTHYPSVGSPAPHGCAGSVPVGEGLDVAGTVLLADTLASLTERRGSTRVSGPRADPLPRERIEEES